MGKGVFGLVMGLGNKGKKINLGDTDQADGDSWGEGDGFGSVTCSICLETVVKVGDRAWAKLQCGHQFHLDCIGSAFNVNGVMQCPNCRRVEKGKWICSDIFVISKALVADATWKMTKKVILVNVLAFGCLVFAVWLILRHH